jgi:disulfide bond formation protein DsbB
MFKTKQNILIFTFLASAFALAFAYISQYVFDFKPCVLCLYQRAPFFIILLISLLALFFKNNKIKQAVIVSCSLLLLANAAIALYQSGIEKKIFKTPVSCSSQNLEEIDNVDKLRIALTEEKLTACDKPEFFFLGLTMANWNIFYCALLAIIIWKNRKN